MSRPVRVIQVMSVLNFGGAENMVMNLYRKIDRSQVQFDFIVHTNERGAFDAEVESLGGVIYHAPRYIGMNHFQYVKWWNRFYIEHPQYKVVHSHIRSTGVIILSIARKNGLITIAHSQNTSNEYGIKGKLKNIFQKKVEQIADYRFACSEEAGKWLFPSRDFIIIKSGIDCERFAFSKINQENIRKEYQLENKFVIGHVGRHVYNKNPMFLLDIFAKIYETNKDARLLQLGKGDMTESMKAKCKELGINEAVLFVGVRSDHEKYYSAMDVLLFPSLWEGLPVTLIEAQTNGLNCVVSDTITKEADIQAGLFHSVSCVKSAEQWAEQVLRYKDNGHLQNAVEFTKKAGFDINNTVQQLQEFYITFCC